MSLCHKLKFANPYNFANLLYFEVRLDDLFEISSFSGLWFMAGLNVNKKGVKSQIDFILSQKFFNIIKKLILFIKPFKSFSWQLSVLI